ncbi:hypothetical protein RHOSPDRAFT_35908 [Rhodotorula sp. JG-1b]|nr:hypothetical protein RHOSPDRAFT_35908 [Rhodotorula sp. JG-1b]
MPPPLSLSMDAAAAEDGADDSSKPAIATRSRASLVDVDLSFSALDASAPVYPGLRACDRCRDRKVRCDRKSPRCTICMKRNETCITTPLLPHQRGGKPWTEADLALAAMSPSPAVAAAASGIQPQPQPPTSSSSLGGSRQQGQKNDADDQGLEPGGSSSSSSAAAAGGGRSAKRPRTRSKTPSSSAGREEATTAWAAGIRYADHDEGEEEGGASTSARMGMGSSPPPPLPPAATSTGSASRRDAKGGRKKTPTAAPARRRRGKKKGRRNDDDDEADEINPNTNATMSPVPPGSGSSPFSGIMTGSPSSHAGFDPPLPPQQQRPDRQPYHRRQASTSSSLQYEYGLPIADNDNDDDDDDDDEAMSVASGAAVATPGSHYSISSSTAEQIVIPPRIHASFFGSAQKEGANQNHHLNGKSGYDLKKKKRETRRALVRVLVEGRDAPFDKVKLEGVDIDLPRLISQVELCDSAYSSLPQAAAAAPPSSSTSPPPPPPPIATTSTTASIPPPRPPPLFSTSPIPCGELYQPTSHQSHLCISTYFSRLEPALELFLPGPTVAHRFLQECNAHWASVDANGNGNGAGDPTTTTRTMTKGWRSMYLASMAMGAMAMTEAEWASIGCTENKTRAGATWLEEAGRLLVESGFARKPTCETFRASLLVIQSCLIGLNGPPDIPFVLENLPQITAAAYELGLHVEPAGGGGGEEGQGGEDDADGRRALWWRFLELQVCWAPLLDRQSSLDPTSFSTLPPPSSVVPLVPLPLLQYVAQSSTATASLKRKGAETSPDDPTTQHQLLLAQQQQQQQQQQQEAAAATALASLHAVLDFSCRAYYASTAPRPPRPRELDKLSQRLLDLVESQAATAAAAAVKEGANPAMAMAELLLDVEVCRLQAMVDEVGVPKNDELEELWRIRAARLVAANPLAGPQVSHTLAITVYLHGLVLIALRLQGDHTAAAAENQTTPTLQEGMSAALETLRTAPWPLPLHQIIQRGIALLEALLRPAAVQSAA